MRLALFFALLAVCVAQQTSAPCTHGLDPNDFIQPPFPFVPVGLGKNFQLVGPNSEPAVCLRNVATPLYTPVPGTNSEIDAHDLLDFDCWDEAKCASYGAAVDAGQIDFSRAYAALKSIMQCEKRIANMMVRTCFHESGNYANNFSGFCSTRKRRNDGDQSPEHRRCENVRHSFFDQASVVVNSVSRKTGVSQPDVLAIGCFVAYEVTGGKDFLETFPCNMQMGRCVKVSNDATGENGVDSGETEADPQNVLPPADADSDPFLDFWVNQGFTEEWAAALMTTHTLVDGKLFNMHHFDFEYVHTMALDFERLGYRCDKRRGNIANAGEVFGDEDRWGFTTAEGANYNEVTRYLMRVPIEGGPSKTCTCYDPQIGGVDGQRGKWTFTVNDCNLFKKCWDYTYFGLSAVSEREARYCQAFKDFANNHDYYYRELGEATEFLTSKNANYASDQSAIINLRAIRDQALNRDDLRLDLCDHVTPCVAEVMGDCLNNLFYDDVKAECGIPVKTLADGSQRLDLSDDDDARSFFRDHYECLTNKALNGSPQDGVKQYARVHIKRAPYQDARTAAEDECINFEAHFSVPVDGLNPTKIVVHAPGAIVGEVLVQRIGSDETSYRIQLCNVICQHADKISISIPEDSVQTCNGYGNQASTSNGDGSDEVFCARCAVVGFEHVSFLDASEVLDTLMDGDYVVDDLPHAMRVKALIYPMDAPRPTVKITRPQDFPVSETERYAPYETTAVLRNQGEYSIQATAYCNISTPQGTLLATGSDSVKLNVIEDPNRPVDCVGAWTEGKCLWGKRIDFFYVTRKAENGGAPCDPATSTFRYVSCGDDGTDGGNGGGNTGNPLDNVIHEVRFVQCETDEVGAIASGIALQVGSGINFVAEVGDDVAEIRWYFERTMYVGSDNEAPFSLFGDLNGNYQCYTLTVAGEYQFMGVPYDANGNAGAEFQFSVFAEGPEVPHAE